MYQIRIVIKNHTYVNGKILIQKFDISGIQDSIQYRFVTEKNRLLEIFTFVNF